MENANKKGAGRKPTNHTVASPFAAKLKAVFWDSGLTQSEAAEKLGVSRQTFNNWLNGQNQPDYSYLIQISKLFGVSCDYLLGVSDVKTLDMDISGCCKLTGLSEAAAKKIIESDCSSLISQIIESPEFEEITDTLSTALILRHLALPDKKVIEQIKKELESKRNSPFLEYALATAKGGLSPYYKQQLSELICKFYDRINQEYLSEDEKYMQSKGEKNNG